MSKYTLTLSAEELMKVVNAITAASEYHTERAMRLEEGGAKDSAKWRHQSAEDLMQLASSLVKRATNRPRLQTIAELDPYPHEKNP